MRLGERVLNQAERKFGKLAFPGILRWVAGFYFLGFILLMFSKGYMEVILFDKEKIMSGEVWRLFSWVFMPRHGFMFLLTVMFTYFLNDLIEETIGTFRTNVYVLSVVVFLVIPALTPFSNVIYLILMPVAFFHAMMMAGACLVPNYVINLMGVIPIKMKWIGWMSAAILFGRIASSPLPEYNLVMVAFGLIPFFVGIFPMIVMGFKNEATAAVRRTKFQRDSAAGEGGAFHTCKECGITDVDDPNLEFRVSAEDGEEYCVPCREKQG